MENKKFKRTLKTALELVKKKMHVIYLTLIASCYFLFPVISNAQDIHFSQFYMSPLTLDPALCGATHDLEAGINYKNQWKSVASSYKTFGAGVNLRLNKKKVQKGFWAGGINFFSDKAGDSKMGTTQGNLTLAYHLLLSEHSTLGAGLQGGFTQRSINYGALQWANQYDGTNFNAALPSSEPTASNNYAFVDMGAGIVWTYSKSEKYMTGNDQRKINIGVAAFHPHQPEYSFYKTTGEKLHAKWVAHGELLMGINNTNLSLAPGFMYLRQGRMQEIYAGMMFKYQLKESSKYTGNVKGSAFSLGAYYRFKDAFAITSLLEFSNYAIGFSYDVNTSGLTKASNGKGGMEIALRFTNPNPFRSGSKAMF